MSETLKFGNGEWATKKGSTLAYNSENGNYKPLPFSFSRDSSATRVNKDGLIETVGANEPRIDYKDDSKGALLLEPSRSNLITYSEDFSNQSIWRRVTVNSNSSISPDGTLNADKLNDSTDNNSHYIALDGSFSLGSYSASIFAKKGTLNYLYIWFTGFNGVFDEEKVWFDLDNGTVGTTQSPIEASIEDYGNGWFKCSAKSTADIATSGRIAFGISNSDNLSSFIGTGNDNIYLWGAQVEQGSYATSYIPTSGSAVTRTVEYSKIINSPILQATNQFTLFFDAKDFLLVNGTTTNFDNIMLNLGAGESAYDSGGGLHIYNKVWYYFNGSSSINIGICYNSLTDSKFAISYDGTSFHKYANGVKLGTYTVSASMVNWDSIQTGGLSDAQVDERTFNIADLKLYNTALTDQELINLTKI